MTWAPDYVTAAQLKSYLRIPALDTVDDAELGFAISAASRAIDQVTNRQFGSTSVEARLYTARYDKTWCRWVIDTDDISTASGVLVDLDDDDDLVYDVSVTDFRLVPVNAADISYPFTQVVVNSDSAHQPTRARATVQVTAAFGWAAVPATIKQATLMQASRFFYRREAPFGIAGSPSVGSELRLLSQADPDVIVAVRPYRRVWGAV